MMDNKQQILDWIEAQIADINWGLQKIEGRREQLFQMKQKVHGMKWEQANDCDRSDEESSFQSNSKGQMGHGQSDTG